MRLPAGALRPCSSRQGNRLNLAAESWIADQLRELGTLGALIADTGFCCQFLGTRPARSNVVR